MSDKRNAFVSGLSVSISVHPQSSRKVRVFLLFYVNAVQHGVLFQKHSINWIVIAIDNDRTIKGLGFYSIVISLEINKVARNSGNFSEFYFFTYFLLRNK